MNFLTEKEENKLRSRVDKLDKKIEAVMPELNDIDSQIKTLQDRRNGVYGRITMLRNEKKKCNKELNESLKSKKYAQSEVNVGNIFDISIMCKKYTAYNLANYKFHVRDDRKMVRFEIFVDSETEKFFTVSIFCDSDVRFSHNYYYGNVKRTEGGYKNIKISKLKLKDFLNEHSVGFKRDMKINNILV